MAKTNELEIEETKKYVTLEQAITQGADALIPYEFPFPNTDLIVEVGLKPITLKMIPQSKGMTEEELAGVMVEKSMLNPDGSKIDQALIDKIPIGTMKKISERITEISGFDLDDVKVDQLKNFPGY